MKIPFSYADVDPLEIPEANFLATLAPRAIQPSRPTEEMVEEALNHPIGSAKLEELASPSSRVLFLVDDNTRQTPAWALMPAIMKRLAQTGCPPENIRILIAAGTHARMTPEEIARKLGPEIPKQHNVILHHWQSDENLHQIGVTADGTPVRVNRLLSEADLVIGIGQIVPHRVMGFTGGATIVQPGVSGREVTGYTHWLSALYSGRQILGVVENPVRQEVEKIARLAGLRFIVNVVMDAQHRVIHVVAGDVVAAHRKGAELSRTIHGIMQPAFADIVFTESYPADYDLWQAAKGIYAAELSVREGGVVVIVTPCSHGVSTEHPEVERLAYHGFDKVKAMVDKKQITDLVAAAHLVHVGRVVCDRARGIMVSPGIRPDTQAHLGFQTASTPQQALEMAFGMVGAKAKVAVLRHGGDVLPLLKHQGNT